MATKIDQIYGNRVRVRVCGLCWQGDDLLMVNHTGLTQSNFWAPPGGGVEFGERAEDALTREIKEETGITARTGRFLFACEYINPPLHSLELFFDAIMEHIANREVPIVGSDPEMGTRTQLIKDVRFMPYSDIQQLKKEQKHGIFERLKTAKMLKNAAGYWKI